MSQDSDKRFRVLGPYFLIQVYKSVFVVLLRLAYLCVLFCPGRQICVRCFFKFGKSVCIFAQVDISVLSVLIYVCKSVCAFFPGWQICLYFCQGWKICVECNNPGRQICVCCLVQFG